MRPTFNPLMDSYDEASITLNPLMDSYDEASILTLSLCLIGGDRLGNAPRSRDGEAVLAQPKYRRE